MEVITTTNIVLGLASVVGVLTGYIWNDQNKKIGQLFEHVKDCQSPYVIGKLDVLKNDIDWIKGKIARL